MAYFPATYQPYQPVYQPTFQNTGIIWVSGELEAQNYPVAPNNAVALWESSGRAVYLKQTDASGRPTLKAYDLTERVRTPQDSSSPAGGKSTAYATKDELAALSAVVAGIQAKLKGETDE